MNQPTSSYPRALVIDDSPHVQRALQRELRRLGVSAEIVATPVEALAMLCRHPSIRVVFVDWHLEASDGRDLLACMAEERPELKFILMSAAEGPINLFHAMEEGQADGVLSKPWDRPALAYVVASSLRSAARRRAIL